MAATSLAELVRFDPSIHNVSSFDCGDSDLNDFLKNDASNYQAEYLSHTRLAVLSGSIVGYITLLADSIILKSPEKKKALSWLLSLHQRIYTFPALKIGRLGVQIDFQKAGIGRQLLQYAVGVVVRLNDELNVGCRFITVDAYPQSISWYEKNGFVLNKEYADPSKTHPSMRFDILKGSEIG